MSVISDIINPLTVEQYFIKIKDQLKAKGFGVDHWLSSTNIDLAFSQIIAAGLSDKDAAFVQIAKSMFLQTAQGEGLDLLGVSHYNLLRLPSKVAQIQVRLISSPTTPVYNFVAGQITLGTQGTDPNVIKLYTNINAGTLNTGSNLDLIFQATATGAKYNIPNNTILELKTSFAGVLVSNPLNPAGNSCIINQGADSESDDQYRSRMIQKWSTLGAGATEDAYKYWAQYPTVNDVSPVRKVRVASCLYEGKVKPGWATVYVAGPNGALSAPELAQVQANFDPPYQKYPMNHRVKVENAIEKQVIVSGTVNIYRKANISPTDVQAAVEAALQKYQQQLDIGDRGIYPQKIIAWIFARPIDGSNVDVNIAAIRNIDLVSPTQPITLLYNEYAELFYTGGVLQYVLVD